MKSKLIAAVILAIIIAAFAASRFISFKQQEPVETVAPKPQVTIGIILPLSGREGAVGKGLQAAVRLAIDDLPKHRLKNEYNFIFKDDEFEPKNTIAAFTRLQHADRANAVITYSAQSGSVINTLAENGKIIQFNVGSAEPAVAKGRYNFVHWTHPDESTREILDHFRRNGFQKVAVITPKISEALAAENAFRQNLPRYPEITAKYYRAKPQEKDFRMLLSFIRNYEPDVILALVSTSRASDIIFQYRASKLPYPLTNVASFGRLDTFAGGEDMFFSDVAPARQELIKRMQSSQPDISTFGAGNIYDAVMLLVEAFEDAPTPQQAVGALEAQRYYEGMVGRAEQDAEGVLHAPSVLKQIKNGRAEIEK